MSAHECMNHDMGHARRAFCQVKLNEIKLNKYQKYKNYCKLHQKTTIIFKFIKSKNGKLKTTYYAMSCQSLILGCVANVCPYARSRALSRAGTVRLGLSLTRDAGPKTHIDIVWFGPQVWFDPHEATGFSRLRREKPAQALHRRARLSTLACV